jgi:hypothetical protein
VASIRVHSADNAVKRAANVTKDIAELQDIKSKLTDLISNFMVRSITLVILFSNPTRSKLF